MSHVYEYFLRRGVSFVPMPSRVPTEVMMVFPSGGRLWSGPVRARSVYYFTHPSHPHLCIALWSWDVAQGFFDRYPAYLTSAEEGTQSSHG